MRKLLFSFITLLVLLVTNLDAWAQADNLEEFKKQLESERRYNIRALKQLYGSKWLTPGTNFAKIFTTEEGPKILLYWVDFTSRDYVASLDTSAREVEYAVATRRFKDKDLKIYDLKILVPHPKYFKMSELGLIDEFFKLKPPFINPILKKEVIVSGQKGEVYFTEDKGCSLHVPLSKGAVIHIQTTVCGDQDALVKLGEKLDLERINTKLNS